MVPPPSWLHFSMPIVPSFLFLQLCQSGSPIRILMFLFLSAPCLLLSIKPLSPPCWLRHLMFILGPWLCLQPSAILCAQYWLEISACSGTSRCPVCSSPSDSTYDDQVGVVGTGILFTTTTPFLTSFLLPLSLLPWRLRRRRLP